jgi:dTDP-4-dehydrorhamnose reductase
MKILVVGGDGMLGHRLVRQWHARHDVVCSLRKGATDYPELPPEVRQCARFEVDIGRFDSVAELFTHEKFDLVVNAAGIVKQRPQAADASACIEVNAHFPHRLATICRVAGARLIHLSTDCVFSGSRGRYTESDLPDPPDLYGRSKLLGEVQAPGCLTVRTSMIGLQLAGKSGLVEWFLAQRGGVRGYTRAIFSGFTTTELARALEHLGGQSDFPEGCWHLAMAPISKFDLLSGLQHRLRRPVDIGQDDSLACDRSLDAAKLYSQTSYRPPSWEVSLDELAAEIRAREQAR